MIFVKISQNFIKSHLKNCLISQISVHRLWHVWGRVGDMISVYDKTVLNGILSPLKLTLFR